MLGYHPQVILAGRRINDQVAIRVARECVKRLSGKPLTASTVTVLGITFKENVPDLRNSKIPDITKELATFGVDAMVHDPMGDPREAHEEYKIELTPLDKFKDLDALILAVSHKEYLDNLPGIVTWSAIRSSSSGVSLASGLG